MLYQHFSDDVIKLRLHSQTQLQNPIFRKLIIPDKALDKALVTPAFSK